MTEKSTTINGNAFYAIEFMDKSKIISISLENISNYFQVIVFKLQNGKMPNYDDRAFTLHLDHLNKIAAAKATKEGYLLNNSYFSDFTCGSLFDRQVLKAGKDLRLCLTLLPQI